MKWGLPLLYETSEVTGNRDLTGHGPVKTRESLE